MSLSLIDGIALGGYRSFAAEPQFIGPLSKINLLIGPNNCGKSNLLRFIEQHLRGYWLNETTGKPGRKKLDSDLDYSRRGYRAVTFGIGLGKERLSTHLDEAIRDKDTSTAVATTLCGHDALLWLTNTLTLDNKENKPAWGGDDWAGQRAQSPRDKTQVRQGILRYLQSRSVAVHSSLNLKDCLQQTVQLLHQQLGKLPPFHYIAAIREATASGRLMEGGRGEGVIAKLGELQNPPAATWHEDRKRFETIQDFVRQVLRATDCSLDVQRDNKALNIQLGGHVLPLESYGTGIHELVILAAYCTLIEKSMICIEEPEIHLHPIPQHLLIEYLHANTSNQYLITTHSNSLIDSSLATVFSAELQRGGTVIATARTSRQKLAICELLGCRASDILQANCLIWVEGPSDRIYLKHWLREIDVDLIEDVHYSIMFYSGSCLGHLTAAEEDATDAVSEPVRDLIQLLAINQNSCIIIDSDSEADGDSVSPTKERVSGEIKKGGGIAWITNCRTIENYIDKATREAAIRALHPRMEFELDDDAYSKPLPTDDSGRVKVAKAEVAAEVAKRPANLDRFGLREQVTEIVNYIRKKNNLNKLSPV